MASSKLLEAAVKEMERKFHYIVTLEAEHHHNGEEQGQKGYGLTPWNELALVALSSLELQIQETEYKGG